MSDADEARLLRAGTVGRAHGLDGSFRVGGPVETVLAVVEVGSELLIGARAYRVARVAGHAARPLLALDGVHSREAAEALTGTDIFVERAALPELEEDEWWADDLEGCAVHDGPREVGVVTALLELPSCEVLEVGRDPGEGGEARSPLLVPLIRDAVREVDLDARRIDVDLAFLGEA